MIHLGEAQVEERLTRLDLAAVMRGALRDAAEGRAGNPVRAACTTPDGAWFAAMPAWSAGSAPVFGAKLVVAIPANARRGLPTHRAAIVLLDGGTGEAFAWVDAEALTRARTAAVSLVATETLARRARGTHAVLGAGAQGAAHAVAFVRAALVERLTVWSRTRAHATALAAWAGAHRVEARVADDPDDAVHDADVVTTCTASAEPLFDARSLRDGTHVNAVGACVPTSRELPGRAVGEASLVVDDIDAARAEAGDIVLAVRDGDASWEGVVALGDVLAERSRPRAGRTSAFVSLGLGIEDVAAAEAVVRG